MCSFTVLGGPGRSENQSLSGVTTICLTLCNTSLSHKVDQVVDCLWNVGPLLLNGCAKLLDIGRNWNTLSYTPIQSIPDMLNGWHAMGEYAGHARTGMFSFSRNCIQILATWGRALSCCNMRWWSWMNSTSMGPSTVKFKPGFIREENTSPKCQTPSIVSICPLKLFTMTNCSQVETPMRTTSMQMSFPETVSDSLCRNYFVMQNDCCSSCSGGWSQTILEVKMLDVEVLGWCVYTWSAVVRPVGYTAKFSGTPLEMAYGREINIKFNIQGNSSGGHLCSQHANFTLPQNLQHLWHCAVW